MKYTITKRNIKSYKYAIVGCGFWGAVLAERLANDLGEPVLVLDKRSHVGGNAYSKPDERTGIEVHVYGSHIFHTKTKRVWDYITRFAEFNHYRHRVISQYKNRAYVMPINLKTVNDFFGLNLSPSEVTAFLEQEIQKEKIKNPRNLEEKALSLVGRKLYEAFIKGYTQKQWGRDPRTLPADIITRLPVKTNYDCWYFDDPCQGIPLKGYGELFKKLLENARIDVRLKTDFVDIKDKLSSAATIFYSGPIDQYFDYQRGVLGWRTLDFEREQLATADYQGTAVMNYAEIEPPYTRIHEFKHFHPERENSDHQTVIHREYPRTARKNEIPYYPINTAEDKKLYQAYLALAQTQNNVVFGGRLGTYRYLNMDQVIESALKIYEEFKKERVIKGSSCAISS